MVKEGKKEKLALYIKEAPRMGVSVHRPELNVSGAEAKVEQDGIRYGYADVKGIGITAARWLEKNQPFDGFEDLLEKSQRDDMKITLRNGIRKVAIHKGQIESLRRLKELEDDALIEAEEELLGIALSDNSEIVFEQYADVIEAECNTFEEVFNRSAGKADFKIAGIISSIRETKTKKGAPMAWVNIENDDGQSIDMTVWQEGLERFNFALNKRTAGIFTITANDRGVNLRDVKILFKQG